MRYLIVDLSNLIWAGLLSGKDSEFGRKAARDDGKTVWVNSAGYGLDASLEIITRTMARFDFAPKDVILVEEGPSSKLMRESISPTYKAGRTEQRTKEQYAEFTECKKMLISQMLAVGAQSCTQAGIEADDVIAYLAKHLPSCLILSTDGDLQACISAKAHLYYKGEVDVNRYGPWPAKFTTLYKALVGDTSDNIKGARGFGDKAFLDLYCVFGNEGLESMQELVEQGRLEELVEDFASLKSLERIVDDRAGVYLSWQLAKQYPEKVNTFRRPLIWQVGMTKPANPDTHPLLLKFCGVSKVVHAGNFQKTLAWLRKTLAETAGPVSFDIETSNTPESDDWLEMRRKRTEASAGIDVLGHELTGFSLTLGANNEYSVYFSVDHRVDDQAAGNITVQQALEVLKAIPQDRPLVVHNASFELPVMYRTFAGLWDDNGWHGFLPNVHDNRVCASYVDENSSLKLKDLSKRVLGYDQTTYAEVTGGRKMRELSAAEVLAYGADDTICTAALYNHFRMIMELEGTWDAFMQVEQLPAYLTALAFVQGTPISLEELRAQEKEDQLAYDKAWAELREFLIQRGWEGTHCPQVEKAEDLTAAFIKEAFAIVTGEELETRVRTPSKLALLIREAGNELLASAVELAIQGSPHNLNTLIKMHFKGEPQFNIDSPPQMAHLLYTVMKLPVRLRNPVTDAQRNKGVDEGSPKTNELAMAWALQNDLKQDSVEYRTLKAVQAMKVAHTRQKLYYGPYRTMQHWRDNLIHASLIQCGPVTRRYASADPNLQQLPKHPKATGEPAKFRRIFLPHHGNAVIVSMDFSGQELRMIADYSRDQNMLDCYIGENKKDMHALTAVGVLRKKALALRTAQLFTMAGEPEIEQGAFADLVAGWKTVDYDKFSSMASDPLLAPLYKVLRALGKKTNFTTEYGAMAPKLAETLLIDEEEAQQYIDAKMAAFPGAEAWKKSVIAAMLNRGYATTKLGARRHLGEALRSGNKWEVSRAERQAVNYEIQGSSAEQTKLAMARFWASGLPFRYDCRFIAPIHDEVVFSVNVDQLVPFLQEAHAMMVAPYADMIVPIVSSISIGPNFGEQIEIGETVDPVEVKRALSEIRPELAVAA